MNRFETVLAIIIWIVGSARLARLLLFDSYPPVQWLRDRWDHRTAASNWNPLLHCAYCACPYVTLITGTFALWFLPISVPFSHLATWFWLIGGWAAGAYAAAILVAYDGDDD